MKKLRNSGSYYVCCIEKVVCQLLVVLHSYELPDRQSMAHRQRTLSGRVYTKEYTASLSSMLNKLKCNF